MNFALKNFPPTSAEIAGILGSYSSSFDGDEVSSSRSLAVLRFETFLLGGSIGIGSPAFEGSFDASETVAGAVEYCSRLPDCL